MNLYMVHWPDLRFSLVSARDEEDLKNVLRLRADPAACTCRPFTRRVWVDLDLDDTAPPAEAVHGYARRVDGDEAPPADVVIYRRWMFDHVMKRDEA